MRPERDGKAAEGSYRGLSEGDNILVGLEGGHHGLLELLDGGKVELLAVGLHDGGTEVHLLGLRRDGVVGDLARSPVLEDGAGSGLGVDDTALEM